MIADQSSRPDWNENHREFLHRFARSRLRDAAAAEDVVQETLLAAWMARKSFAGRSAERTWLVGILRHKIIDHIRASQRLGQSVDPSRVEGLSAARSEPHLARGLPTSRSFDHPRQVMERKEMAEAVDHCIERLDARSRAVVTAHDLNGSPVREVALRLRISANHASVLLFRARRQLKDCLCQNWLSELPVFLGGRKQRPGRAPPSREASIAPH